VIPQEYENGFAGDWVLIRALSAIIAMTAIMPELMFYWYDLIQYARKRGLSFACASNAFLRCSNLEDL